VEQQGTGELTGGGSVRGGDEEDANEKLVDEHGDAGGGGVVVWWCVVVCGGGFFNGWFMTSKEIYPRFYIRSLIFCEHEKPQVASAYHLLPGLPVLSLFSFALSLDAQPVPSLLSFSPPFHSSSSHLCIYRSQPRLAHCVHSLRCFIRRILVSPGT
jgi:hypothetical protein